MITEKWFVDNLSGTHLIFAGFKKKKILSICLIIIIKHMW